MAFSWEFHGVHDSFEIFMGPEKCNLQGIYNGILIGFFMPFSWHKNNEKLVVI